MDSVTNNTPTMARASAKSLSARRGSARGALAFGNVSSASAVDLSHARSNARMGLRRPVARISGQGRVASVPVTVVDADADLPWPLDAVTVAVKVCNAETTQVAVDEVPDAQPDQA